MGIRSQSRLDPSSNIVRVLIDMYVDIGDSVALQYGGSEAHKKVNTGRSESNIIPIGKVRSGVHMWVCLLSTETCFLLCVSGLLAQRIVDFHSAVLFQRIHRPIQARCYVSRQAHVWSAVSLPLRTDPCFLGISFWEITFRICTRLPCGNLRQTTICITSIREQGEVQYSP